MKYILVKPIDATFSCSEGSVVGIEIGLRARTVERERERELGRAPEEGGELFRN